MNRTAIEWVRGPDGAPGFTWNPIVGCSRGCDYCYASRIAQFVRADATVRIRGGDPPRPEGENATCSRCGRVQMPFLGFL